jgi:signal-transduction protein with cAMP-binding, CBS, and nucleotidyltransferase domain
MTPAGALNGIPPGENAADAMLALGRQGVNQLPVLENGRVRGLVSREDILKLLSLYGDPALAS